MARGPRCQNRRQASGKRVCTNRKLLLHTNHSLEFRGKAERTLRPTDTEGTSRTWAQLVWAAPLALCVLVGGGHRRPGGADSSRKTALEYERVRGAWGRTGSRGGTSWKVKGFCGQAGGRRALCHPTTRCPLPSPSKVGGSGG